MTKLGLKTAAGIAMILAGAVLMLFLWDTEFGWFQGGPLGLVLTVLGVVELAETVRKRSRT